MHNGALVVERELMLTGIGGQGVQLAAQVVARAAARAGLNPMVFGLYSGVMRGGNTDATVVVADGPIESPPIVSRTWSALVMHHRFWASVSERLAPEAVLLLNSSLFEADVDRGAYRVFDVAATDLAARLGNEMTASMVMVGAYVGLTGLVPLDAATGGLEESLPPYRRQHLEVNREALRAGFEAVDHLVAPAWEHDAAGAS
jgi:2-oxoglutarate ferredoxin oxidoreductase subunit gamma